MSDRPPTDTQPPQLHRRFQGGESPQMWGVLLVLIITFLLIFGASLWLTHANHVTEQHQELSLKAQSVADSLRLRLKGNEDYLTLLAAERANGKLAPESFQHRASQYVRFHNELINVTWVDADFIIQDVAPLGPNRQIVGLSLNLPEPKRVSRLARDLRRPVYTRPFEAIQGKPSFEVWIPVFRGDTFLGLFGGVYSCDGFIQQIVSQEQKRLYHATLVTSSGGVLAELPVSGPLAPEVTDRVLLTTPESGILLQLTAYRQETQWGLLLLQVLCLGLFAGIVYLVLQQMRANAAVRRSEKRLRELLEDTHLAAVFLDTAGRVTYCNRFLLELTGRTADETLGADWFDLFVPEELREEMRAAFENAVAQKEIRSQLEVPLMTRDGKRRILVWDNTFLHRSQNQVSGVASLGIDMTGQKNLEEQLRQAQKMEAIGELAGGVAHDFNNILTVIGGFAAMLQYQANLEPAQNAAVDQIIGAAEKAAQLTQGLLAFSRKQVIDAQTLNLNDIVLRVRQFLARVIGENIQLKTIANQSTLNVHVDRGQIEQVLINLATNARDAMPRGGKLTIETTRERIETVPGDGHGLDHPGEYAVLTVSDNGQGMEEDVRSRLFEPFFTTKEVGKGTGLGMAIVYGIVKQHKGQINVYSELGHGTTFRIYLPLVEGGSAEELPRESAAPRGGTETILLAEDDAGVRALEEKALTGFGYRVIIAEDGEQAVELFREHGNEIDLIVMDLMMPKKTGTEAYADIRQMRGGIRVLYTSGYPRDFIERREDLAEGSELLLKPVQPLTLVRKVREMLDRER